MLTNAVFYGLGNNEFVWRSLYAKYMPTSYAALNLAPNPDIWQFSRNSSKIFLYKFVASANAPLPTPQDEVRHVVTTMNATLASALVQRAAVYIVRRLSYHPKACTAAYRAQVEEFRGIMGKNDVIMNLLRVVYNYTEDPVLLSGALCAIGNVVIDDESCKRLVDCKGLGLIMKALQQHESNYDVIDYGCFALCNIADDGAYRDEMIKEQGIEYALRLLDNRDWARTLDDLQSPLELLAILVQNADAKLAHGQQALDRVANLLMLPDVSPRLLTFLLTVLVVACEACEQNCSYAHSINLFKPTLEILKRHENEVGVFVKATLCLFTLTWQRPEPEMAEMRLVVIDHIIRGMTAFPDELVAQRTSAAMLSDYAHSDPGLKNYIKTRNGKFLVERALALPGSEDDPEGEAEWRLYAGMIHID